MDTVNLAAPPQPPPWDALLGEGSRGRADIWPIRDRHTVQLLDLTELRMQHRPVTDLADELASLADASWALDRSHLAATSARRELNLAAAASFAVLARNVGGDLGASLIRRAEAVARGDWSANARLTVDCDDHRVVVVYGPLKTWSTKDDGCRFSATVSVPNIEAAAIVAAIDDELPAAISAVARACDAGDLRFWHVPGFVTTDLLACGGEANTFPKHFAFFLPEDAGVREPDRATKTVVFTNVYAAQFASIARPIGEALLDPPGALDGSAALRSLLLWFRGHDVGHFLGPHSGQVDHLAGVAGADRGALQEAFADVIGYLLASTPSVLTRVGADATSIATVFLSEMLRYFRRGWQWFPDSAAARIELRYLVAGGWLELDEARARVKWQPDALRDGITALGRDLCAGLLDGAPDALGRLVDLCNDDTPAWLQRFEALAMAETAHIGDNLVYGFAS